jgi:hypothetical protein
MGSMESIRLKALGYLPIAVLLGLSGVFGMSSMGSVTALGASVSVVAHGAHRGAGALTPPSRSFSTALVNGSTQEQVDPSEDRDQAPAGLVFPSLAPLETSTPPAFGLGPRTRRAFVDSTAARGPPSA